MAVLEIPINPTSPRFSFSVDLDGHTVDLSFSWNLTGQYWTFGLKGQTLTDTINGAAVVTGIDMLAPYAIRELGQLWCIDSRDLGEDPNTIEGFGTRWFLMYVEIGTEI